MSKEEQILNLIKVNNGIITAKEVCKHGINSVFLPYFNYVYRIIKWIVKT